MRAKLLKRGARALNDYEIPEILLMAFILRRDVQPIAKALQTQFGSLSGVLAAPPEALVKVDGACETVAAYLKSIARLSARAGREAIRQREVISSWSALVDYVRREILHEAREQFRLWSSTGRTG